MTLFTDLESKHLWLHQRATACCLVLICRVFCRHCRLSSPHDAHRCPTNCMQVAKCSGHVGVARREGRRALLVGECAAALQELSSSRCGEVAAFTSFPGLEAADSLPQHPCLQAGRILCACIYLAIKSLPANRNCMSPHGSADEHMTGPAGHSLSGTTRIAIRQNVP